jgi:hypothetical protein
MILNKQRFIFIIGITLSTLFASSCVDVPDKAPDIPELKAEFRFISLSPSDVTTPSSLRLAEVIGVIDSSSELVFGTYSSYALPANGTPTPYMTFNAGTKKIVYTAGDTLVVAFETDQRATLVFAQNSLGIAEAIKMPYRYTFAPNGVVDSATVRFTNLLIGATDTIDVYRSDSTFTLRRIAVDNLRRGLTSPAASLVKIPSGRNYKFFFTNSSDTNRVFKDSIEIVGASRKIYSVFLFDRFDSSAAPALRNANVKVKVLEEL